MTMPTSAVLAGHVGLEHDLPEAPGGGLRALVEEVLGKVVAHCPPFGAELPALHAGTFIVDPPFYGSGDIGHIAVCSTVNALAAGGARPRAVTLSAIVEAGLPLRQLRRMADSARDAAEQAEVVVCDVDVRVVRAGEADQIYLHTTGIGVREPVPPAQPPAREGDAVVVTAPLGGYGAHILSVRRALGYESVVAGDCAPLTGLLAQVRGAAAPGALRAVRALGRGGLAAELRALARAQRVTLSVHEQALPVQFEVRVALDALALDPLDAPSSSCLVLLVAAREVEAVLAALHAHPRGQDAAVVGEVAAAGQPGAVELVDGQGGRTRLTNPSAPPARLA